LARDGAEEAKADFAVVRTRRHDHSGSASRLLMPRLRMKGDPDEVTSFWNVGHGATTPLYRLPGRYRLRHGGSSS
jgi:hypothetical protein